MPAHLRLAMSPALAACIVGAYPAHRPNSRCRLGYQPDPGGPAMSADQPHAGWTPADQPHAGGPAMPAGQPHAGPPPMPADWPVLFAQAQQEVRQSRWAGAAPAHEPEGGGGAAAAGAKLPSPAACRVTAEAASAEAAAGGGVCGAAAEGLTGAGGAAAGAAGGVAPSEAAGGAAASEAAGGAAAEEVQQELEHLPLQPTAALASTTPQQEVGAAQPSAGAGEATAAIIASTAPEHEAGTVGASAGGREATEAAAAGGSASPQAAWRALTSCSVVVGLHPDEVCGGGLVGTEVEGVWWCPGRVGWWQAWVLARCGVAWGCVLWWACTQLFFLSLSRALPLDSPTPQKTYHIGRPVDAPAVASQAAASPP